MDVQHGPEYAIVSLVVTTIVLYTIGGAEAFDEIQELLEKLPVAAWIGILLVITLMEYVALRLNYGWGARFYFRRLAKANL